MRKLSIIDSKIKDYRKQLKQRRTKVETLETIRSSLVEKRSSDRRKILIKALSIVRD